MLSVLAECFRSLKAPVPRSVGAFPHLPDFSASHKILPSKAVCSHFSWIQYLFTLGSKIPAQICLQCMSTVSLFDSKGKKYTWRNSACFRESLNSLVTGILKQMLSIKMAVAKSLITTQADSRQVYLYVN